MSIKHVILGFLSDSPLTGYDLKKKFSESDLFHWSGNNNQIYKTLVELHSANFVTVAVEYQESKPPRKVYTITESGLAELSQWVLGAPELPQFRSGLLMQLVWADESNTNAELARMLAKYADELEAHMVILREKSRRNSLQSPKGSLMLRIAEHHIAFYEMEHDWVVKLQQELNGRLQKDGKPAGSL